MRVFALAAGTFFLAMLLAASDAQDLFNRARRQVLANLDRTPRYTCIETITREVRRTIRTRNACSAVAESAASSDSGLLMWHDRLRLDVAVIDGNETFAWAGARRFETEDMDKLVGGGATGTGDFAGFLSSVFGTDARNFRYAGEENTSAGRMARFSWEVPLMSSHYRYRTRGDFKVVPYSGWFLIDPATARLQRLAVVVTELDPNDDVCRVEDQIDYQTVKIGDGEFLLPGVSVMNAVYARGSEARNETRYSGCHEYSAQSSIRFDDAGEGAANSAQPAEARQPLPPGVHVLLALDTPIDGETTSAGDEVVAQALNDSKSKSGTVVVHRGDRFHGRIIRLEQYLHNQPHWVLGLRFESVVRNGIETPVALNPLDDGVRIGPPHLFTGHGRGRFSSADPLAGLPLDHPPGSGMFVFFEGANLALNSRFHSSWAVSETAAAPDSATPRP